MDLGVSGLASNFDWRSLVDQLTDVERLPQRRLRAEQNGIQNRINAYNSIQTQLGVLQNRLAKLKDPVLFEARKATSSDSTIATATASSNTPLRTYSLNITQMATASRQTGTANAGAALNSTDDVSSLVLSDAAFAAPVTAGDFTVNGKTVTIATSDTLQSVFDKISTATSGAVTASYDAGADKITLSSSSAIVLGSATDNSNFLQAAKLANNGGIQIVSSDSLGAIKTSGLLSAANFATAITDGGSGAGVFKINGVEISFNASADSVTDVLNRINDSSAGVTAAYDAVHDQFSLTNKVTGDLGIALEDVTGNFLAAARLSTGTLTRGHDLLYTIDGGSQLSSQSNTITEASSGIPGLSIVALKEGSANITASNDSEQIKTAITNFITEYNKTQSLIATQTASSTDAKGKVTAGVLAGERDANDLSSKLRNLVTADVAGLSGAVKRLEDIGIGSNGNDDTLAITDSAKLDAALASNLSSVKSLFSDATNGLAVGLDSFATKTIGDDGTLIQHTTSLGKESTTIDSQVDDQERFVQAQRQRLINSFLAMETAQAHINQQLSFLQQRFGAK